MVHKRHLDPAKKRPRRKAGGEESSNRNALTIRTLNALQAMVFKATPDRCRTTYLKELYKKAPLLAAAFCGHGESVDVLLKEGHNPNVREKDGNTPLMLAIKQGHGDIASKMIDQGADPNIVNKEGMNAVHMVVRQMDAIMLQDVWNSLDSSCSSLDKDGKTLLHVAAELGWDFGVTFLLSRSSLSLEKTNKATITLTFACEITRAI